MKLIIALAAGLLATGASAETTMTRTTTARHVEMNDDDMRRHHVKMHRVCKVKWRNHHRIRTCRTTRWR
jgi:hypothetical protein